MINSSLPFPSSPSHFHLLLFTAPHTPSSLGFLKPCTARSQEHTMHEAINGEELLTLSLGFSGAAKKRKVRDAGGGGGGGGGHDRLLVTRLLQARDDMAKGGGHRAGDHGGERPQELMRLLLSSAYAAEAGEAQAAAASLHEVYRRASFRGDPGQRVAARFADALASRLLRSPVAPPAPTRVEQFLAFTMFYQASPYYQFAHFTANQAIVEAFERGGHRRLHVVDFDVSYGFQWPSLIQSLSDVATISGDNGNGDPVSLRITGLGTSPDELRETEARLAGFASGFQNVRFEFDGVLRGPRGGHDSINTDEDDATVVVNLVFPPQNATTMSSTEAYATLAYVHSLNPSMVFLVERELDAGESHLATARNLTVLPRFTACLRYFAAVFDSLHECLPADSAARLAIERDHLGREIASATMASLDDATTSWKERMESAGFDAVKLSSRTVSQAKLLLKMKSGGGGFRVVEKDNGTAMSLAWRDRALITATGWRRCR